MGGTRSQSIGGVLDWTPTDWFDATLRANYSVDDDELPAMVRLGGPVQRAPPGAQLLPGPAGLRRQGCTAAVPAGFLSVNSSASVPRVSSRSR